MEIEIKELELDILSNVLRSPVSARKASDSLDGYQFSERSTQWIWRAIKEVYASAAKVPPIKVLALKAQNDIKNDSLFNEVVDRLKSIKIFADPSDLDVLLPEIIKAYNQQRILTTVDQLIDAAEKGDLAKAQDVLTSGSTAINRRNERTGSGGLVEIAKRALEEEDTSEFTPTGLAWVDRRIRGIAKGEVFLIAGITGIGKSISMIAAGQAGLGAGKRVLHVTTEMTREQVTWRYLSRFTGIPEKRIRERRMSKSDISLLTSWLNRNENRMNDLLRIERVMPNSGTMVDIQASLEEHQRDGNSIDVLIIDSPDHLRSIRKYQNWLHESSEVWWGVKAIAGRGHAVWCTTQIKRGIWETKLATPEAVADNYNIARIADAFFSINWDFDPNDGKPTGKRRMFFGKYRSGENRQVIPLRCDLSRMIMVTESEPEELETELVH